MGRQVHFYLNLSQVPFLLPAVCKGSYYSMVRLSLFIEFVMARCKLWPKHAILCHFRSLMAATIFVPLSVVAQANRFSGNPMIQAHLEVLVPGSRLYDFGEQTKFANSRTAVPIPYPQSGLSQQGKVPSYPKTTYLLLLSNILHFCNPLSGELVWLPL